MFPCVGFAIVGFPALSLAADAPAPVLAPDPASGWIITLGGSAQVGPKYDGASKAGFSGIPAFSWRRANEPAKFSAPDDSLDLALVDENRFSFGPAASFRPGRYSGSDPRLRGLRDVPWTIEAGGFAEFWPVLDRLRTRVEVKRGFHGHRGFVADASVDWVEKFGRLTLSGGPRLEIGDTRYARTYFAVTPAEAALNGFLTPFDLRGGAKTAGLATALSYELTPQWTTTAYARYDRIVGNASRSPIVRYPGQRDQLTLGVGATYSFKVGG